jgi:tetratricopeptide (TPR) repeat protein
VNLRTKNARLAIALVLAGLIGAGGLARVSLPHMQASERIRAEEVESAKESIALSLLGQVQFTVGSLMWLKTMEYLHNGVPYRTPTNAEEERGQRASNSTGTAEGLAHQEGVSMTLTRKTDWRGPVGDLHRELMPYMADHRHSDPRELIPWYRLATRFNPNLERLYVMGAFFMSDFAKAPNEALDYLLTGVSANPYSFEIHAALGRLYYDAFQAYDKTVDALRKATEYGAAEQARLTENKDHFDDYQKQMLRESYLFLAKALTDLGRYDEANQVCDKGYVITNHSHLNIQKRIIEKSKKGEAVDTSKNVTEARTDSIQSAKSGVREAAISEEEEAEESIEEEGASQAVGHSTMRIAVTLSVLVSLAIGGFLMWWRRMRTRAMAESRARPARRRILAIAGAGTCMAGLGLLTYMVWPEPQPVFATARNEAVYCRDHLDNRHKRLAANLVDAGDSMWEKAEGALESGQVDDADKLHAEAAGYYRAAQEAVRNAKRARKLSFPKDRSLGKISSRPWGKKDAWEGMGEAKGIVSIPAGHEVDLAVRKDVAPEDVDLLTQQGEAVIQSLNFGETQVDDAALSRLRGVKGLRDLSLYGTPLDDKGLEAVCAIASIETLNLGNTRISDSGLQSLVHLPALKTLNLAGTRITDLGMASVGQVTSLRTLWLTSVDIGDEGVEYLKELPNLRILWLGNTSNRITDAGVSRLAQLNSLKELWIGSNAITETGVSALRKALPKCRIKDAV